ncbi:MAG: peptide deformylase [Duncaniella sp.]|nr:peptide deformylase [Duncaniella sp.]
MKLPVYLYGHPVLRKECADVTEGREGLKELVANMFETMYASDGCGLAAPQVGLAEKIVVIDADGLKEHYPECEGEKLTLINPVVTILDGDRVTREEGCLSLPGLSENVSRVEHIRLDWVDEEFKPHSREISGFLARIVQHECDHLDGHLYIDHVSMIRRRLLKGKLNNIIAGKVRCDYPVKYAPKR